MIPIGTRIFTLGAKVEGTIGTWAAPGNSDAGFRVMNASLVPTGQSIIIPAGTGVADIATVAGPYAANLRFDIEGYAAGQSWMPIFFPSCGFLSNGTSGGYAFSDPKTASSYSSISAGLWYSTALKKGIYGAMGSMSIRLTAGQAPVFSFNYKGAYKTDPGTVPAPTWQTSAPPVFASTGALTVDADATIAVASVEITSDDYAFLIPSPNVAGAFLQAWLRKPSYRVRMSPLQAIGKDWIGDWLANGTSHTMTAVVGTSSGNIITISATLGHATAPGHDEQDEQITTPLEFAVLNNSLTITPS